MVCVPNFTEPGRDPAIPALTALLWSASEPTATSTSRFVPARGVTLNDSEPAAAVALGYGLALPTVMRAWQRYLPSVATQFGVAPEHTLPQAPQLAALVRSASQPFE